MYFNVLFITKFSPIYLIFFNVNFRLLNIETLTSAPAAPSQSQNPFFPFMSTLRSVTTGNAMILHPLPMLSFSFITYIPASKDALLQ